MLRGYTVGSLGYGYQSKPVGEAKFDKKGRLRAEGFKPEIVPTEAAVIQRIFSSFAAGTSVNEIVRQLNREKIPNRRSAQGAWRISTVTRILKNELRCEREIQILFPGYKLYQAYSPLFSNVLRTSSV